MTAPVKPLTSDMPENTCGDRGNLVVRRRCFLAMAAGVMAASPLGALAKAKASLPREVAGIALPQTQLALKAAAFCRRASPEFLFNHCMRTFLFGALDAKKSALQYDAETAFVAAALHDLGLLKQFETGMSFEMTGAERAEAFVHENGGSAAQGRTVWNAIVAHDKGEMIERHLSPEAVVVGSGAGDDVIGYDPAAIDPKALAEVLQAFPRLQFKTRFAGLITAHCKRKPLSQRGTWLEGFCRATVPDANWRSTRAAIMAAPFPE